MNTRALFRWTLSVIGAVALLGVIGLALNPPVQARANFVHDWPGLLPPCNTPSLQQCIDGAVVQAGDTIHIKPGVYTQSITLNKAVSLMGDNRATTILVAQSGQRVLTVTGNLTTSTIISGLSFTGGLVTGLACPEACGGAVLINGTARPTLQNLRLSESTAGWQGGGLWVDGTADVKLVGVSFFSNTSASDGGGLWTTANTELLNSSFERNISGEDGGGVFVGAGYSLSTNNTSFSRNTAQSGSGGGAAVGGVALLTGGSFRENSAATGGGLQASALIMTSTELISNSAGFGGGGAFIFGPAQLLGGKFSGNSTTNGSGGGLSADSLRAQYTYFISNTAMGGSIQQGGGINLLNGPNQLDQVWFQNNEALSNGGALYATGPTTLTAVSVISNTANVGQGGGIFAGSPLVVQGGSYVDNFADVSGGGLFAPELTIDGAHIDNNRTTGDGGGVHANNGLLVLINSHLRDNHAGQKGGGVYASGPTWITNTFLIRNTAPDGGGLYQASAGDVHIVNALFAGNQSTLNQSAAIAFAATGSLSMVHSTIVDNVPNPAYAISIDNGNAAADIRNSIIGGHAVGINLNSGGTFEDYNLYFNTSTNISGPVTMGGNSLPSGDPRFANPLVDDYHLRFDSQAINAGTDMGVNFDIDGQPRPIGPGFDIGFDETGTSIQQLIDVTPPGGTVVIPPGVYTESLNLYKPVSLIGAGNGATVIQATTNDRVLTVTGAIITSSTQIADLALKGGSVISGGTSQAGGGVLITNMAYPSFNNVQIISNSADFGGGLYVHSGGVVLNNSIVANNHATQSGGGVYVVEPAAVVEQIGGVIQNNTAVDGAGVFVQSGQFRQASGTINNNIASNWGGGILIGSGGSVRTNLGQILNNVGQNAGGGILVDVGTAEVLNSVIQGNSAYEGGGVYVRNMTGTSALLIGGKVENNTATRYGGGAYALGTLSITGTRFFNNTAYDGSAVEITGTAQARISNAFIAGNPANGAFPSTNSSLRFDSSANSVVFHTTFGNASQPLTRALSVNSGVVTVANTIVASYTVGLSWFGGRLAEDYNLFYNTPVTGSDSISHGGHSLVGLDPQFKGAAIGDYHIKGLSPAVNRGTNVGVRRDVDGDVRPLGGGFDIGADEASVAGVTPGPNTGGSFLYTTMQNSTIYVNVPPGAVTQTVAIYCSLIDTTTVQPLRNFRFVGIVFELDANLDPVNVTPGSIAFNEPVTLSVSYTDQQLAAAGITDELTVQLYRFEPLVNDWKPVGYRPNETQTLDVNNNLITATVLGFSRFGGMSRVSAGTEIFLPLITRN